jgi:hypothetical protein
LFFRSSTLWPPRRRPDRSFVSLFNGFPAGGQVF